MAVSEQPPVITVIVAVRNGVAAVGACLESILSQTFASREIIVLDGGSQDGTADVITNYAGLIAYFVSEPDRGVYDAWNKGLTHARGDWICFLGADDRFHDTFVLERLQPYLAPDPGPGDKLVYGMVDVVDAGGAVVRSLGQSWQDLEHRWLAGLMALPHPALMHHRTLFSEYGSYDASFMIAGDFEFLFRCIDGGVRPLFVPGVTTCTMAAGGMSQTRRVESLLETRRALRRHGRVPSFPWYWAFAKANVQRGVARTLGPEVASRITTAYRKVFGW